MDARDRMASALATTRSELILEAFDRRLESLGRRLEGLAGPARPPGDGLRGVRAVRGTLRAAAPPPAVAAAAARAAGGLRLHRLREPLPRQPRGDPRAPGRLRAAVRGPRPRGGPGLRARRVPGAAARSAASPRAASRATPTWCRSAAARGWTWCTATSLDFLRAEPAGSLGGVFAAQVAEHLPPAGAPPAARGGPPRRCARAACSSSRP